MKKILLIILSIEMGVALCAAAKDKGETAHPASQKTFTFQ